MNHTERKYYIKTQYGLVEVEQHIYYAFYDGKEEENKQKKKLKYNNVISYDGLDTESYRGADLIEDINFRTDEEAISHIDYERIRQIILEMDKRYIVRLYLLGYKEREIALMLGISQAAVNKAKRKILKVLRDSIE